MTDHSGHEDCELCGGPSTDDAYVCKPCMYGVRALLRTAARLAGEAEQTITRQTKRGPAQRSSGERGTTFDPAAADAHWVASNTLMAWVRHCVAARGVAMPVVRTGWCEHVSCADIRMGRRRRLDPAAELLREIFEAPGAPVGPVCPARQPDHPQRVAALWMVGQLGWLRWHPDGPQALDELRYGCEVLVAAIDRPRRWWAGPCLLCGVVIHPTLSARVIRCGECGAGIELDEWRTWLLGRARDLTGGAAWVAHVHTLLGVPLDAATVRQWAARRRLLAAGRDQRGRALYRLGDATALARGQNLTVEERVFAAQSA